MTTGEIHIVERGQPLFWSWSPDATQLAVHVENRVLISDSAGRSTRVLTDDAGPFVTPWWLPGGSVVYAVGDRIVAAGPDDAVTTLVARGSSGRFSLDPEGQRLAYIASTGSDANARSTRPAFTRSNRGDLGTGCGVLLVTGRTSPCCPNGDR